MYLRNQLAYKNASNKMADQVRLYIDSISQNTFTMNLSL